MPWTDAGVAFMPAVKYISLKDSEGNVLVSAYAPTVYAVWRINRKRNKSYGLYFQPKLT
jgi:hypothetical protein